MRMPWAKSEGGQLELLDAAPSVVGGSASPALSPASPAGLPLFVSTSALEEDPNNPRTEMDEAALAELAEDIRQRGILQPIVVQPPDLAGRYRIHFGARRWRAALRVGLDQVPIVVREVPADPYAQVAENLKRHGLSPLDLARFIRQRIDAGESNSEVARRLGMNLTTVAHHLSLLELPPEVDAAMKSGRCTSPRTLHELGKLHAQDPQQVQALLASDAEITRATVSGMRSTEAVPPARLIAQAVAACDRLENALARVEATGPGLAATSEFGALLARVEAIAQRWRPGSDRQTPPQAER